MTVQPKAWPAIVLSLLAGIAFGISFFVPFVSSDFRVSLPAKVDRGIERSVRGSERFLDRLEGLLGAGVRDKAEEIGGFWMDAGLEHSLGEVGLNSKGEGIPWSRCLATGEGAAAPGWRPCVKAWISYKAGIPVGVKTLSAVILGLFAQDEWLLGALLSLFSICFPALKVGLVLFLGLALGRVELRHRLHKVLELSAKWSMTDVFVVALMIVFFKADSFNFHFQAEIGVYLFAVAAILSSFAVMSLPPANSASGLQPQEPRKTS